MPITIETDAEFFARHGGNPIFDPQTRHNIFPDGAAQGAMGGRAEPPANHTEQLRAKRRYLELKLAGEESAFRSFQQECAEKAQYAVTGAAPGPPLDAAQQLARGKVRIEKLREDIAQIDREIAAMPDEISRRVFDEQRRAHAQRVGNQVAEINAVTI